MDKFFFQKNFFFQSKKNIRNEILFIISFGTIWVTDKKNKQFEFEFEIFVVAVMNDKKTGSSSNEKWYAKQGSIEFVWLSIMLLIPIHYIWVRNDEWYTFDSSMIHTIQQTTVKLISTSVNNDDDDNFYSREFYSEDICFFFVSVLMIILFEKLFSNNLFPIV